MTMTPEERKKFRENYEKEQRELRNTPWWIEMELLEQNIKTALKQSKLEPIDQLTVLHQAIDPLLNRVKFPDYPDFDEVQP